jgi:hypothetical protein
MVYPLGCLRMVIRQCDLSSPVAIRAARGQSFHNCFHDPGEEVNTKKGKHSKVLLPTSN